MSEIDHSTAEHIDKIHGSLDSLQGAAKSLACKASTEGSIADEAWTLYDAIRAIRRDVKELGSEIDLA